MNEDLNLTLGQKRVGVTFNPSQKEIVKEIKMKSAELIDLIDSITHNPNEDGEKIRLKSLAQTSFEQGSMWAVKAATKE